MIAVGRGCVLRTIGETLIVRLPGARIGDGVLVRGASGACLRGTVTAIEREGVSVAPFGSLHGIAVGDGVESSSAATACVLGGALLGRAVDAAGNAIDGGCAVRGRMQPVLGAAIPPLRRRPVERPFWTGIRAIDGLLTLGRGARVGLFGAPGAGKTTLLETIASGAQADAVVLALIGERGREAATWMTRLDRRTTIVCATSDRSAAERSRAAEVAMAQAVALRDRGLHVLLLVDSLARYCAALREQRSALGEPVGRGGYPPSVFADLARFLERAGNGERGSITMLATVLSDGAEEREPLSDAARSLLDGHFHLSGELARAGRYPAIDILASTSRTMHAVIDEEHAGDATLVCAAMSILERTREARSLGIADASDAQLARVTAAEKEIERFLAQRGTCSPEETLCALHALAVALR